MEKFYKALDEVIKCIVESDEYKMCLLLKERMEGNKEIVSLVEKIKILQKKYIKNNKDNSLKRELDKTYERLNEIPIYSIYLNNLEKVNEKIEFVKDRLNDYFYNLLNGHG